VCRTSSEPSSQQPVLGALIVPYCGRCHRAPGSSPSKASATTSARSSRPPRGTICVKAYVRISGAIASKPASGIAECSAAKDGTGRSIR
jgi:hypothetical protein